MSVPLVLADAKHVGLLAAELIANRIRARPSLRVLLPTGRTPLPTYAALRAHAAGGSLPTAHLAVLGLDEYAGLRGDDPRSFRATLDSELAGLSPGRREALNGAAPDLDIEAARYQAVLDAAPIDLAVLGLGRDGHVAFDEPGSRPDDGVHRVTLTPTTIEDAAPAFGGTDAVPCEALTVGLSTLLAAREILLLVTGAAKAESLRSTMEGPVGPPVPATMLRKHPRLTVLCDRPAAARLAPRRHATSDHVVIVLGHREPGVSAEHRISAHSRARMRRAAQICEREAVRAVVLTGFTHTGGLSEAEQIALEWPIADVPVLLEVAGRNTAENASRSLPLNPRPGRGSQGERGDVGVACAHAVLLCAVSRTRSRGTHAARPSAPRLDASRRRGAGRTCGYADATRGRHDGDAAARWCGVDPLSASASDRECRSQPERAPPPQTAQLP